MANRAQRRIKQHTTPHNAHERIIGRKGSEITLAADTIHECKLHIALYNSEGIEAVHDFLNKEYPARAMTFGDTAGEQIVEGSITTRNWQALRGFLEYVFFEDLPEAIEKRAYPDELVASIDTFFHQTGMRWVEDMVKNSARSVAGVYRKQAELLAQTTAMMVEKEMEPILAKLQAEMIAKSNEPDGTEQTLAS